MQSWRKPRALLGMRPSPAERIKPGTKPSAHLLSASPGRTSAGNSAPSPVSQAGQELQGPAGQTPPCLLLVLFGNHFRLCSGLLSLCSGISPGRDRETLVGAGNQGHPQARQVLPLQPPGRPTLPSPSAVPQLRGNFLRGRLALGEQGEMIPDAPPGLRLFSRGWGTN